MKRTLFLLSFGISVLSLASCSSRRIATDVSRKPVVASGSLKERYAALLNIRAEDLSNEKLYRFIDNWIGVPHKIGGMSKQGVDCSGFTTILANEIYGLEVPRTSRAMADAVRRKYENELKEGDLVFFDFNGQKFSHVGVYLHNGKFVHASTSKGVIISDLRDPWYYKYFSRGGEVRKSHATNDSR